MLSDQTTNESEFSENSSENQGKREVSSAIDFHSSFLQNDNKLNENMNMFLYQLRDHSRLIRERKLTSPEEIQSVRGQLVQDFFENLTHTPIQKMMIFQLNRSLFF